MKLRWIIVAGLLVAGVICGSLVLRSKNREQKALEETQRVLRGQGFKIALDEFNFFAATELRNRAGTITNAIGWSRPFQSSGSDNEFMTAVGSSSALVMWRQAKLGSPEGDDRWANLRETFKEKETQLDAACEAVLSGPFRFDLNAGHGAGMLLPHLAMLKNLSWMFSERAMLELHDGHLDAAWNNVMATTHLVTGWEIEPTEVSYMVRYACFDIAYNTLWQALQADEWSDARLFQLQHELESVDFLRGVPDTVAFDRASKANLCQLVRQQPPPAVSPFGEMLRHPRNAWADITAYWRQSKYRLHGTFEEERDILLFYRDREVELRNAAQASSWLEMRQLPGITKQPVFQSKFPSVINSMIHVRQISLTVARGPRGLMAFAAKAETERRLIIIAAALERFHRRNNSYPASLAELTPEFLQNPAVDFMDGRPMRYHRTENGRFLLYSVGLDCIDNDGKMTPGDGTESPFATSGRTWPNQPGPGVAEGTDLAWPLPATEAEVEVWREKRRKQMEAQRVASEKQARAAEAEVEANRQAAVAKLLSDVRYKKATWNASDEGLKEPNYKGQPLGKFLRNRNASGTNEITLDEMLTLKPVITGEEPEIVTYQLPVSYDTVTNLGLELTLVMDSMPGGSDHNQPELEECERATNGDCLLAWNTAFERPGPHALQVLFMASTGADKELEVKGPVMPFFSSNLCQFFSSSSMFDKTGAFLFARLPESNGVFSIEIKTRSGEHVRTLAGSTSNAMIDVEWDLLDEQGRKYTNDSIDSFFNIKLPDSGRSQTLRQTQNKLRDPDARVK